MGNWFKQHGWGVSQVTTSVFPGYHSKTKTKPEFDRTETLTGRKPDHADPVPESFKNKNPFFNGVRLVKKKVSPAPDFHATGSEATKAKLLSNAPHKLTYDLGKTAYTKLIKDEKYFPNLSDTKALHLDAAVQRVTNRVPPGADVPPELHGANAMLLTQVISAVSKERPNGVDDVIRGLDCLQNINLLDAIRNPANATAAAVNNNPPVECPNLAIADGTAPHANATYDNEDLDCAWRLAQVLGSTPAGFDLLNKITVTQPAANVHPSVAQHDSEMLHVYLDGTRELVLEAKKATPPVRVANHPNAIDRELTQALRRGNNNADVANPGQNGAAIPELAAPNNLTVLQKGLIALKDHLTQSADHAAGNNNAVPGDPFIIPPANLNGCSWAITFIRNGVYTDKLVDENGDPTLYARLNGRTEKTVTWARRAYTRPDTKIEKAKYFVKRHFAPQLEKSPFNAYNILGKGDNAVGFAQAERMSGIAQGRVMKENLIPNVMLGMRANGGGTYAVPAALNLPMACVANTANTQPTNREMTSIVRLAILEETLAQVKILPRYTNCDPLDRFQMEKVKDRIYAHFGGNAANNGNLSQANRDLLEEVLGAENNGFDPQTLINWAGDVGGPATAAAAVGGAAAPNPAANQPDWGDFGTGINHVVNGIVDIPDSPNLNKVNPNNPGGQLLTRDQRITAMAGRYEDAVAHQELGQRFTFGSGGKAGFKTGGLTFWVTTIASLGMVRVKPNVGYERARKAVFDAGTFTTGNELILGTETAHRGALGGGVSFGPGKLSKDIGAAWTVGASASADVGGAIEHSHRRGAVLRFRRTYTSSDGDKAQNARLGRLTRKMVDPGNAHPDGNPWVNPGNASDQASSLKSACQEFPDLSVSWMDTKERTGRTGTYAGVGAGFYAWVFRLGLAGANVGVEGKKSSQKWRERGGSLHVEKNTKTVGFKASASVTGPLLAGVPGATSLVGLPGLALGEVGGDFHKVQYTRRDSFIREDGKFHPRTYRTKSFANANDLYRYAAKVLGDMVADKARYYNSARYHPELGVENGANLSHAETTEQMAERKALMDHEYLTLKRHLLAQLEFAELNQIYQLYYEPKPETVVAVNYWDSCGATALAAGDKKGAEECAEKVDKILDSEEAWHHGFLVDQDYTNISRSLGWNVLGVNQGIETADFGRIRNWT
jgi:hypothetical protein